MGQNWAPIEGQFSTPIDTLCYLSKQIDHAESALLLGDSPDTVLIVRAMLEGLCQLKWAAQVPAERAKRWHDFAWVHDWRAMRVREAQGEPVDLVTARMIHDGLQNTREQFFTRRAAAAAAKGCPLPRDPFHSNWTGMSVDQVFAAVGADELYVVYKSFSDWQHWSLGGIGRSLSSTDDGMNYAAYRTGWDLPALAITFQCLWETVQLVNDHIGLSHGPHLQQLHEGWVSEAHMYLAAAEDDAEGT